MNNLPPPFDSPVVQLIGAFSSFLLPVIYRLLKRWHLPMRILKTTLRWIAERDNTPPTPEPLPPVNGVYAPALLAAQTEVSKRADTLADFMLHLKDDFNDKLDLMRDDFNQQLQELSRMVRTRLDSQVVIEGRRKRAIKRHFRNLDERIRKVEQHLDWPSPPPLFETNEDDEL